MEMSVLNETERDLVFLDFTGLDFDQERELLSLIHSTVNVSVQLPWSEANSIHIPDDDISIRVRNSGLNVHAPSFKSKHNLQNTAIVSEDESSYKCVNSDLDASSLPVPSTSLSVTQHLAVSTSHPPMKLVCETVSSVQISSLEPLSKTCETTQPIKVSFQTATSSQFVNTPLLQTSLLTESTKTMPLEISSTSQSVDTPLLQTSLLAKSNAAPRMKTSKSKRTLPSQSIDTPCLTELVTDAQLQTSVTTPFQVSIRVQPVTVAQSSTLDQSVKVSSSETHVPLSVHTAPILLSQSSEDLSAKIDIVKPINVSITHSVGSVVDQHSLPDMQNPNAHKLDKTESHHYAGDMQFSSLSEFPDLGSVPIKSIRKEPYIYKFPSQKRFPKSESSFNSRHVPENIPSNLNFPIKATDCEHGGKNLFSGTVEKSDHLKTDLVETAEKSDDSKTGLVVPVSAISSSSSVSVTSVSDTQCEQLMWVQPTKCKLRSFADVLREKETSQNLPATVKGKECDNAKDKPNSSISNGTMPSIDDKFAIDIGRYFKELVLDFSPLFLQPRGLINSGNWCYMNASIQALLACSPFCRLLKNFPAQLSSNRGKSSTPILDNMVCLAREFISMPKTKDGFKRGSPFHPEKIYDQIGLGKSDCLKGQQEDAEEFLSYILNGIHGEMASIMKNYESKSNPDSADADRLNNNTQLEDLDTDDEWQVMGANRRGIITRQVENNKSKISDLVGGEFKTFLTTNGKTTTSASVQPFFTLQLDIQAENVHSLVEALNQLTVKEPVQGYTCTKTNQEVEAYSKIFIQKLPPVLIFHLKRFVYNPNGGCKKLLKCTDYPIILEIKRDLLSPEIRKLKKPSPYRLFAVMYHDGEESMKGHYLTDVYNHGNRTWIRCDDRNIYSINEFQVLSYRPPRVPYLLFYQALKPVVEQ